MPCFPNVTFRCCCRFLRSLCCVSIVCLILLSQRSGVSAQSSFEVGPGPVNSNCLPLDAFVDSNTTWLSDVLHAIPLHSLNATLNTLDLRVRGDCAAVLPWNPSVREPFLLDVTLASVSFGLTPLLEIRIKIPPSPVNRWIRPQSHEVRTLPAFSRYASASFTVPCVLIFRSWGGLWGINSDAF